ncbi:MAG TPA: hypothetical protein PK186_05925 [candidate division Zixibacteria bacterium]|nr:hypothetical protein [candidate division Zixibacteria bacterium]MDD4918578.1 hypothetical protein [candidate division Zixibacteria bacterium]MDM7971971.1 hypothetical protein [candidate division Zixibacteria bacterium]HOD65638.1 hypothetical protein [candidate division Zixibacteria bacterium]HPM37079.1 hypothetical protein [candidate division Zixibacteria bacterium]
MVLNEGTANYVNKFGIEWPICNVGLGIYESNDGVRYTLDRQLDIGASGYFSFQTNNRRVRFYFVSINASAEIVYADNHDFSLDDETFWLHAHGIQVDNPEYTNVYVPEVYT